MRVATLPITIASVLLAVLATAGCTSSSRPAPKTSSTTGSASSSSSGTSASGSASASPASSSSAQASGPAGGPVPAGFLPTSVTFASTTEVWVLGTAPCSTQPCTSILRSRDGGSTWVGIPAPKATLGQPDSGRNGQVSVLRFADAQDGWAGVGQLYSTHNGGATWVAQSLPGEVGVVSNIESGGGYVFVTTDGCPSQGGNHCSQTEQLYSSPVGRDSWSRITTVPGGGGSSGLVVQGANWYIPTVGGVHHGTGTKVAGTVANPCPSQDGEHPRPSLAVASSRDLDAMCVSDGGDGSARYQLYGTTDGGAHWSANGPSHIEPSGLTGIADNTKGVLLAATASGASTVLRTTNDGSSFHSAVTVSSGGDEWADLGFTTPTQAVVVLLGMGLYLSHDSGATFSRVTF